MMPTKITDPLQYLVTAVADGAQITNAALEAGSFSKDNTQSPVCYKGKSAVVFAFQLQKKTYALKIWPAPASNEYTNRYLQKEQFLLKTKLPYFTSSRYLKDAIRLKGQLHDALLMDWAGRQTIKEYILTHLDQKEKLQALAEKVLCMHLDLNQADIAHGQLHCGNIYVNANDEIKLIDYDCMFINGLMEPETCQQQYPDYCHPANSITGEINQQADYFAALIIFLGIKAIAANNVLWGRFKVGFTEGFLFNAADFADIKNAPVYKYLRKNHTPETDRLLTILHKYCTEPNPDNLKPFYAYLQTDFTSAAGQEITDEISKAPKKEIIKVTPASDISSHQHITIPISAEGKGTVKPAITAVPPIQENTVQAEDTIDLPPQHVGETPVLYTRKLGARKANYETTSKKQQTRFLVAAAIVCAIIVGASFLLGEIADNANNYSFRPAAKADTRPVVKQAVPTAAETAAEKPLPVVKITTPIVRDSIHAVPPPANNLAAVKQEEKKQPVDSTKIPVKNIQAITGNKIAKNTAPEYPGRQEENTNAVPDKIFSVPVHKPASRKKQPVTRKQADVSFAIGAPPKQ